MPKRAIDEKTRLAGAARQKETREQDNEGANPGDAYEDENEMKGIDEDLANPELEDLGDEDEEDAVRPPPLDGPPSKLTARA